MNTAPLLAEGAAILIKDYVKANIVNALTVIRTNRADAQVVLQEPLNYFLYEPAKGYKTPAMFFIVDDFDFKITENMANHINGTIKMRLACVVEDRDMSQLTYKTWRYQSALHSLLAQTHLTTTDNKLKITVVVKRASFSPAFSPAANKGSIEAVFRKEVMLELDVVHRENY